jgi:serine kinase of HPr protein (carbohydrate metabolism regulator)
MAELSSETLHATTVAIDGRAVVLNGPPGAGKSDLALRLMDRGATLVSDDITILRRAEAQLLASAPDRIRGKLEVRGLGLFDVATVADVPVALLIDLSADVPRFPLEQVERRFAGIAVPVLALHPFEMTAPVKVEWALKRIAS